MSSISDNFIMHSSLTHSPPQVIVLSQSGTPPYPPTSMPPLWSNRGPDWIWDWNSRPEAYPPKVCFNI